jgi:hypothetical protein
MMKIRIKFEYRCFPVWQYDCNDSLIENELPNSLLGDTVVDPLFVNLQEEFDSLFKDDGIEFKYIGFGEDDLKNQFIRRVDDAIKLLHDKLGDSYVIEKCLNAENL